MLLKRPVPKVETLKKELALHRALRVPEVSDLVGNAQLSRMGQ
jgi:hypothetical protein